MLLAFGGDYKGLFRLQAEQGFLVDLSADSQ